MRDTLYFMTSLVHVRSQDFHFFLAYHLVQGLAFLHSRRIAHRVSAFLQGPT